MEVLSLLLNDNIDEINAKDGYGKTALMLAAENNPNPEVISFLLKNGADAHMKYKDEEWLNGERQVRGEKRAIDFAGENDALKDTEAFKRLQETSL